RATRRPEVPEEKRDVLPRQGEDLRRNELLVATQSEQPQAVQPLGDGVSVPMCEPLRGAKPESGRSRGLALVPYGLDTEMPGRFGDHGEVLLIGVGVADRLTTHERAITYEVRQHDDLFFRPLPHPLRLGDVARNRDPVPGFQGLQGLPTVKGEEGMVTGGGDLPPGLQPQTENLFDPA